MIRRITSVVILAIVVLTSCISVKAEDQPTLIKMHATAYCLDGITASGEPVREGICASGHRDWIGKTVIIYQRLPNDEVGRMLWILEVKDTGCKENVIDIWQPTLDDCQSVMDTLYLDECKGRIYCQVIDDARG